MEKKDLLANYAASKQNMCITNDTISDRLFQEYGVNRGLRDVNGKGVLTGLTRISKIVSFKDENGKQVVLFETSWNFDNFKNDNKEINLLDFLTDF